MKNEKVGKHKFKLISMRRKHHSQSPPTFTIFPIQKSILFQPHSPENKSCNNNEGTCEWYMPKNTQGSSQSKMAQFWVKQSYIEISMPVFQNASFFMSWSNDQYHFSPLAFRSRQSTSLSLSVPAIIWPIIGELVKSTDPEWILGLHSIARSWPWLFFIKSTVNMPVKFNFFESPWQNWRTWS